MKSRGSSLTAIGFIGLGVAIIWNATDARHGRHPAPMAVTQARAPAVPVPVRRPDHVAEVGSINTPLQFPKSIPVQPKSRQQILIEDIQRELAASGMYDGPVDGLLGPMTDDAIRRYRKDRGLAADGPTDQPLLDHIRLNRRIADIVSTPLKETIQTPPPATAEPAIRKPAMGDTRQIELVQRGRAELGYSPGPVDGMMGEQTRDAIRKFQRDRQIEENGKVSRELLQELRKVTGVSVLSAL